MEDTMDVNYRHANNAFKKFKLKNLGEYHNLYVQSDTLLLADAFENFRIMCIKVYKLDPAHFLSAPGLAWQACLKKTKVKLELLANVDMLLMVEEGIRRGGICHAIHRNAKESNTSYSKNQIHLIQIRIKIHLIQRYSSEHSLERILEEMEVIIDSWKRFDETSLPNIDIINRYWL